MIGTVLRALPADSATLTVQYRSAHDPEDPDGDSNTDEADGNDCADKYCAQILLAVEGNWATVEKGDRGRMKSVPLGVQVSSRIPRHSLRLMRIGQ